MSNDLEKIIFTINEKFYEKVYEHPWLKEVFKVTDQKFITEQQTAFMVGAFGGPKNYSGRLPNDAHPHIYIDEEMWQVREELLQAAFNELNISPEIQIKWLKIDNAFKAAILKKSVSDCVPMIKMDGIIVVPNPNKKKAA
jgi:truncated hemoglobin YjbI